MLPDEWRSPVMRLADSGMPSRDIVNLIYLRELSITLKKITPDIDTCGKMYKQINDDVHNFLILNRGVQSSAFDSDRSSER